MGENTGKKFFGAGCQQGASYTLRSDFERDEKMTCWFWVRVCLRASYIVKN